MNVNYLLWSRRLYNVRKQTLTRFGHLRMSLWSQSKSELVGVTTLSLRVNLKGLSNQWCHRTNILAIYFEDPLSHKDSSLINTSYNAQIIHKLYTYPSTIPNAIMIPPRSIRTYFPTSILLKVFYIIQRRVSFRCIPNFSRLSPISISIKVSFHIVWLILFLGNVNVNCGWNLKSYL